MTGNELIDLMLQSHRRVHVVGTPENGVIAALDLEGRLFAVVNGKVQNRVVPSAIMNRSNRKAFLNPGGDALWPAPEGTCYGYEYGTGKWRVPPAITGAVWEVVGQSEGKAVIRAEIDLINNRRLGIPCEFERHVEVTKEKDGLTQNVTEVIRYLGDKTLAACEFRLAPWSLCQFDVGEESRIVMPPPSEADVWDMYGSSLSKRGLSGDRYVVDAKADFRFQLGLGKNVPWAEYRRDPGLSVKRSAGKLPTGQSYIDIADAPPGQTPSEVGVKLSVYCDPSGFMEIEACGGCPDTLVPGDELSVNIATEYRLGPVGVSGEGQRGAHDVGLGR